MISMKSIITCFLLMALVVGCYPTSEVRIPDSRPRIAIKNAPDNAILYVDGLKMGLATRFSGVQGSEESGETRVLLVEPGRHRVEVKSNGELLLSEDVFLVERTLKTLTVTRKR